MARKIEEKIETSEKIDAKKVEKKSTEKQSAKTTATKKPVAKKTATNATKTKATTKKDAEKVEPTSDAKKVAEKKVATKKPATKKTSAKSADEKQSVVRSVASKTSNATSTSSKKVEQEEYMNPEQLAYFKKLLEDWKDTLFEDMQGTIRQIKEDTSKFADPADRASQEEEFSLELRTRDRERKLIKKINESLGLIESGDYGYCKECGEEIGIKRLKARPTATLCVDCKELQEARERQSRS